MIPHVLRNLSELDIENLMCGRITAQTMHEAAGRLLSKYAEAIPIGGKGDLYTIHDRELADELNDMLEAARKMREANGGIVVTAIKDIAKKRAKIVAGLTEDERDRALDALHELAAQAQELDMGYEHHDISDRSKCWNCDKKFIDQDDMVAEEGDIWICKACSAVWDADLQKPFESGGTGF